MLQVHPIQENNPASYQYQSINEQVTEIWIGSQKIQEEHVHVDFGSWKSFIPYIIRIAQTSRNVSLEIGCVQFLSILELKLFLDVIAAYYL